MNEVGGSALDETGLDEEQLAAVTSEAASLCVLASAGSGKTRVLTRRVDYRVKAGTADPNHVLVLTFTRKAATELRDRLRALGVTGVTAGTFHAIAYAELKQHWQDNGKTLPVVTANPVRHVDNALASLRLDRSVNARSCLAEISWAKAHGLNSARYTDAAAHFRRRSPLPAQKFVKLWDAYENEKKKHGAIDFDDLLLMMVAAMRNDRGFAETQRWKFRHLFVDEFQDLNRAQFNLLRAWLGLRDDLFVVGDPNQAIYGFNGADASFLENINSHFPDMEVLRLTTNYRSTPQVLAAGDAVLGRAARHDGVPGLAPTLRQYGDERTEALGIARQLRTSCSGKRSWNDAAVLVRTNAQRGVIEDALVAAGIPVRAGGGSSWLHRVELKEMIDYMRANDARRLIEIIGDLGEMAADCGAPELGLDLVEECRLRAIEDVQVTVRDAIAHLEVSSRFDPAPSAKRPFVGGESETPGVTVTTFHRAKGLEWPVVMLAGLEDGLVPLRAGGASSNKNARNDSQASAQLEEERRLLYVAVTRAKEELHCSFAAQRTTSKGDEAREPSLWLTTLAKARIEEGTLTTIELSSAIDSARKTLVDVRDVDLNAMQGSDIANVSQGSNSQGSLEVRDCLESWRAARCRLTGIAPELMLADGVIEAIAVANPQTLEELACIDGVGKLKAVDLWQQLDGLKGLSN